MQNTLCPKCLTNSGAESYWLSFSCKPTPEPIIIVCISGIFWLARWLCWDLSPVPLTESDQWVTDLFSEEIRDTVTSIFEISDQLITPCQLWPVFSMKYPVYLVDDFRFHWWQLILWKRQLFSLLEGKYDLIYSLYHTIIFLRVSNSNPKRHWS